MATGERVAAVAAVATGLSGPGAAAGAVQRGGELKSDGGFADAFRPAEQPGVRRPLGLEGAPKRGEGGGVADDAPHGVSIVAGRGAARYPHARSKLQGVEGGPAGRLRARILHEINTGWLCVSNLPREEIILF
jgi:hypothetical protein